MSVATDEVRGFFLSNGGGGSRYGVDGGGGEMQNSWVQKIEHMGLMRLQSCLP